MNKDEAMQKYREILEMQKKHSEILNSTLCAYSKRYRYTKKQMISGYFSKDTYIYIQQKQLHNKIRHLIFKIRESKKAKHRVLEKYSYIKNPKHKWIHKNAISKWEQKRYNDTRFIGKGQLTLSRHVRLKNGRIRLSKHPDFKVFIDDLLVLANRSAGYSNKPLVVGMKFSEKLHSGGELYECDVINKNGTLDDNKWWFAYCKINTTILLSNLNKTKSGTKKRYSTDVFRAIKNKL